MKKIIVIGGGAAGIIAAIRVAEHGAKVTLFEKMPRVGRKLCITGKGRCNLTNTADIVTLSRQAAKLLAEGKFVELEINLKPALTPEQLDARILRDFDKFKRKAIKNSLIDLLPAKLIPIVLDLSYLPEDKRVDEITLAERRRLAEILRGLPLTITKTRPIDEAIVTSGGVSTKEIDPRTMQSKLIDGLFIVGEVADVDGFTGGFNLQAAWSMGNAAGNFAV